MKKKVRRTLEKIYSESEITQENKRILFNLFNEILKTSQKGLDFVPITFQDYIYELTNYNFFLRKKNKEEKENLEKDIRSFINKLFYIIFDFKESIKLDFDIVFIDGMKFMIVSKNKPTDIFFNTVIYRR